MAIAPRVTLYGSVELVDTHRRMDYSDSSKGARWRPWRFRRACECAWARGEEGGAHGEVGGAMAIDTASGFRRAPRGLEPPLEGRRRAAKSQTTARRRPPVDDASLRRFCCVVPVKPSHRRASGGFVRMQEPGSLHVGTPRWSHRFAIDALFPRAMEAAHELSAWREHALAGGAALEDVAVLCFGRQPHEALQALTAALPQGFWSSSGGAAVSGHPVRMSGLVLNHQELLARDVWQPNSLVPPTVDEAWEQPRGVLFTGARRVAR